MKPVDNDMTLPLSDEMDIEDTDIEDSRLQERRSYGRYKL